MTTAVVAARIQRVGANRNWGGFLVVLGAIGLWELLLRSNMLQLDYVSAPSEIAPALGELARSGELAERVRHTTSVALRASAVAAAVGIVGGVALATFPIARVYSTASIDFLRSIPVLALFPVAVLLWGPSGFSEVAIATYSATWPVLLNTAGGVRAVHPRLRDVAQVLQLSRFDALRKVVVPAALLPILVGVRLSLVSAFIVSIVAEMIINPEGLGWGLVEASQSLRPERMWAYAVVAGALGYLVNTVLLAAVRRLAPGSPASGRAPQ